MFRNLNAEYGNNSLCCNHCYHLGSSQLQTAFSIYLLFNTQCEVHLISYEGTKTTNIYLPNMRIMLLTDLIVIDCIKPSKNFALHIKDPYSILCKYYYYNMNTTNQHKETHDEQNIPHSKYVLNRP
jgi:hypothetical protein